MKALGRHLMVEYYDCNSNTLNNPKKIEVLMNEAARISGATIVNSIFHSFNPYGVSGVVVIAESHLAIHTWPEHKYAAVDLFTCGNSVDPWKAFEYLNVKLNAKKYKIKEVFRGILDEETDEIANESIEIMPTISK